MKQISAYILIIALIVATAGGVLIIYAVMQSRDNMMQNMELLLNGESQKELRVNLTDLHPGSERDYTLRLKAEEGAVYEIEISFLTNDEASLAPYIDVQLFLSENLLSEGKLNEYLNADAIAFEHTFENEQPMELKIAYKMDLQVGNEAQGKEANFKFVIKGKEK